jgi:predicted nucleic acid-binding protein
VNSGLLTVCQPADAHEQNLFVQDAARFRSDGEAMCLAIAESRGWSIATDDRKAIRVAQQACLSVISCPELVSAWVTATKVGRRALVQVLTDIEALARFRPSPSMSLADWWYQHVP